MKTAKRPVVARGLGRRRRVFREVKLFWMLL